MHEMNTATTRKTGRSWRKPFGAAGLLALALVSFSPLKSVEANTTIPDGQKCHPVGEQGNCHHTASCHMFSTSSHVPPAARGGYCTPANRDTCGYPGAIYGKQKMETVVLGGKKHYCLGKVQGFRPAKANGESCTSGNMCDSGNCGRTVGTELACAPAGYACVTPSGMGFNLNQTRVITVNNVTRTYRCEASAVVPLLSSGSECQSASQCVGGTNARCSAPTKTGGTAIFSGPLGVARCHSTNSCPWSTGWVSDHQKRSDFSGTEYRCVSQGGHRRWLPQKGAGASCISNAQCSSYNCQVRNKAQNVRQCAATGPGAPSIGAG